MTKWNDEYWPLLLQMYRARPEGVKPLYSPMLVDMALFLHITPQELRRKMAELNHPATPQLRQLLDDYRSPRKLQAAARAVMDKEGYGTAGHLYDDIDIQESWEKDFRPLADFPHLTPVHLIMILNLYFQLTPTTMVADTDEVVDLSRQLRITPRQTVDVLDSYKQIDPFLRGATPLPMAADADSGERSLLPACREVWARYGNDDTDRLAAAVEQLKEWFSRR